MTTPTGDHIEALRNGGLSFSDIGARLGIHPEAARGLLRRWRDRSARLADARPPLAADVSPDVAPDEDGPSGRGADVRDIDLARLAIAKVTRAEIRLKHSLLADAEIKEVLRQRLLKFDSDLQNGRVPDLHLVLIDASQ